MNSIQQLFRDHGAAYLGRFGDRMPNNHKKVQLRHRPFWTAFL